MIDINKKRPLIMTYVLFVIFSLTVGGSLFTQEETDPIENPLTEGTYLIVYYQELTRRSMTGYLEISKENLSDFQKYYAFYYGGNYASKLMIEKYERPYDEKEAKLIKRYKMDDIGNIVLEQTFTVDKILRSFVVYEYDDLGRVLREAKYNADGKITKEKKTTYRADGTRWIIETYSKGRLVEKEVYGENNRVKKKSLHYYFPDGTLERIEELNADGVIQQTIYYEDDGSLLQKVYYKDGKVDKVVNIKPLEEENELSSFNAITNTSELEGNGVGPNIVVINEMVEFMKKIMSTEDKQFVVSEKVYNKTSIDFILGTFKSVGIDLEQKIRDFANDKGAKDLFGSGKIYSLYYYLNEKRCIKIPSENTNLKTGDLLFFDYILDTDGDFRFDKHSHIGLISDVEEDGTATFYHCLSLRGGIQIGKINLKNPKSYDKNSILKVVNERYLTSQMISGVGRVDYIALKGSIY